MQKSISNFQLTKYWSKYSHVNKWWSIAINNFDPKKLIWFNWIVILKIDLIQLGS